MTSSDLTSSSLSVTLPIYPLEKLQIALPTNGSKKPALHKDWVENINFLNFCAPSSKLLEFMTLEQYELRIDSMIKDVDTLLRLPHYKFWSQAVFDPTLQAFLNSFLKKFPKCWEQTDFPNGQIEEKMNGLKQKVFLVFLRLSTYKESNEGFMSPEFFSQLHNEYRWLEVLNMCNFCAIFYQQTPLLEKICENIIKQNVSNFKSEFSSFSGTYLRTIRLVKERCGLTLIDRDELSPGFNPAGSLDLVGIFNISNIALEMTSNLYVLADTANIVLEFLMFDTNNLMTELFDFVELTLKAIIWTVEMISDSETQETLLESLKLAVSNVVFTAKLIAEKYLIPNLTVNSWQDTLAFLRNLLSLQWTRSYFDVDAFCHDAVAQLDLFSLKKEVKSKLSTSNLQELKDMLAAGAPLLDDEAQLNLETEVTNTTGSKIEEAMKQVKDILPEASDEVILYYLRKANLSVDQTINDLFEHDCKLPGGVSIEQVQNEYSSFSRSTDEKDESLSRELKEDIVSKFGFVEYDPKFEIEPATSAAQQFQSFWSREANALDYDDEYDDTYDTSVRVADSFENREMGFQVQNPNWGWSPWSPWKTSSSSKAADWNVNSEDEEQTEDDNKTQLAVGSSQPDPQPTALKSDRGQKGAKSNPEAVDPKRESFPNQPKSRKSHRHTEVFDASSSRADTRSSGAEKNHPADSFGGARPKQVSARKPGNSNREERQVGSDPRNASGKEKGRRNFESGMQFQSMQRQSTQNGSNSEQETSEGILPSPREANNSTSEANQGVKKPLGRGRGYTKKSQDESSDQPRTKSFNPRNRKSMAARKNNYNAPNFF